jgi:hypothetical protein
MRILICALEKQGVKDVVDWSEVAQGRFNLRTESNGGLL